MKTSLLRILTGFALLTAGLPVYSQGTWDLGVSYRYIRYNEATFSLSKIADQSLNPHELDVHFRFDIGDPRLRGTLNFGWARYTESEIRYDNIFWNDCETSPMTYHIMAIDQHAYRVNPGIETTIQSKGKFSYGCGAGIFFYGTFKGNKVASDIEMYFHRDSLTGECIDDSIFTYLYTDRASARVVQLVGLTAHMYAGYEAMPGLTFFAMFSVNPMFSTTKRNFALAPSGNAGVYFRFRNPQRVGTI